MRVGAIRSGESCRFPLGTVRFPCRAVRVGAGVRVACLETADARCSYLLRQFRLAGDVELARQHRRGVLWLRTTEENLVLSRHDHAISPGIHLP